MYNRDIPQDAAYAPVEPSPPPPPAVSGSGPAKRPRQAPFQLPGFLSGGEGLSALFGKRPALSGEEGGGLSGLLKSLHLDNFDSGDLLLLLIMLYLLVEGDDLDLVIALGVVLLMGLWEEES